MSTNDAFDRQITTWLNGSLGAGAPDYLDETLSAIGNLHQRPAWRFPGRWLPVTPEVRWAATARLIPMLAVLALVLAAGLLALALAGSHPRVPTPYGLARPGLIAFDGDGQVVLARPDGSDTRPLHPSAARQFGATFSRDGTRIAFWQEDGWVVLGGQAQRTADVWVVDADGSHAVNLTPGLDLVPKGFAPAGSWSPDGSSIVFSAEKDAHLYVAATDGSAPPRPIGDAAQERAFPAWAPDGSLIAFAATGLDARGEPVIPPLPKVYVIRPDGSGQERVSRDSGGAGTGLLPQWSPDGRTLLYDVDLSDPATQYGPDGQPRPEPPDAPAPQDLVIAERGLTGWTERVLIAGTASWMPVFSNDGSRIAFVRPRPDMFTGDLFVVGVDGTGVRPLSDELVNVSSPCWSPDDRAIAMLTGPVPAADTPLGWPDRAYALFPVDGGPRVEIRAGTVAGVAACSWQRLAP